MTRRASITGLIAATVTVALAIAAITTIFSTRAWSAVIIERRPIGRGVAWRHIRFSGKGGHFKASSLLFPANRVRVSLLDLRPSSDSLSSELPHAPGLIAVNGGFFDTKLNPVGLFRIDGHEVSPLVALPPLSAVLAIDPNGRPSLLSASDTAVAAATSARQCGPSLIDRGGQLGIKPGASEMAERTVIAFPGDGSMLLIKTDAVSMFDLATCLTQLPAAFGVDLVERAAGLDGGPSVGRTIHFPNLMADEQPRGPIRDAVLFRCD